MHLPRHKPIVIRTLADLKAHRLGLNARCEACRYRRDLDLDALIELLGPDYVYVGNRFDPLLKCSRCGVKGKTSTRLHLLNLPGSPPKQ